MAAILEKCAIELNWSEVRNIISEEIKEILNLHVQCKVTVVKNSFWDVTFIDYRLPLSKFCQLLQATQATLEDWEDALPDEGGVDVNSIGIVLAEKLISRHLKLTWEHHLITANSLWLVGVAADTPRGEQRSIADRHENYWKERRYYATIQHQLDSKSSGKSDGKG